MGKFPNFFLLLILACAAAAFGALAGFLGGLAADMARSDLLHAGFMHDAGSFAGALGLIAAVLPMRRVRRIDLHRTKLETSHAT